MALHHPDDQGECLTILMPLPLVQPLGTSSNFEGSIKHYSVPSVIKPLFRSFNIVCSKETQWKLDHSWLFPKLQWRWQIERGRSMCAESKLHTGIMNTLQL